MKCLPHAKVKTAKGNILHDSHAEILAIRGFNRWLVDECHDLAKSGFANAQETDTEEKWLRWAQRGKEEEDEPPFELREDVYVHMYCSEAPCGDASMELVMREQEDDTPWDRPLPSVGTPHGGIEQEAGEDMLGRGYFDRLGVVRRKPARPDAPITLSKSCSDKLALKQCTGLLSALVARLVRKRGTWLSTLTLPESQVVDEAMERCFGPPGRMAPLLETEVQERWKAMEFEYRPFGVLRTRREFEYSKRGLASSGAGAAVPSNLCAMVTPQKQEILINGVLQGRKQEDPRGASCVSRRRMWEGVDGVLSIMGLEQLCKAETYDEMKRSKRLEGREVVKRDVRASALKGWRKNEGDGDWRLDGVS